MLPYIMDSEEITKHLSKTNFYEVLIFAKDGNLVLEESGESKDVTVIVPDVAVEGFAYYFGNNQG